MNEMPDEPEAMISARWYVSQCRRDLARAMATDLRMGTERTRENVLTRHYFLDAALGQLERVLGVGG